MNAIPATDSTGTNPTKMKRVHLTVFLILALLASACTSQQLETPDSRLHIKRSSIWVPDLDRAVVFFRDVIGFEIDTIGTLDLDADSVLFELFNVDPAQEIRRALFSSALENRVLFVMASADAPSYAAVDKRSAILVIRTDDMAGVIARAKAHDFAVGSTNVGTSAKTGNTVQETTIFGPGGTAVLMYEVSGPDSP